jgi:hypothetical protein
VLLRVQDHINVTPTFKQIKNLAAADLDGALYARILGGRLRL